MELGKYLCLNCGKDITHKQLQRPHYPYKYCSRSCFSDARYGKKIIEEPEGAIESRNPLYLEALKLLQQGFTQSEAARRIKLNRYTLNSWIRRHDAKTVFDNRICQYCGVSLAETHISRKYCTISCYNKAKYREKHTVYLQKHETSVFEGSMEMYWRGIGGSEIARHFDIPIGTVLSWIHDFGGQKERIEPLKNRVRLAKTANEWLMALRENALQNNDYIEDSTVHLVCGDVRSQSVNRLTAIIYERLKAEPLSGEVFAFCNKSRNIITTFSWQEPVFNITKHVKMHGTFIWPHEDLGVSIEITSAELEYLISFCKTNKKFIKIT